MKSAIKYMFVIVKFTYKFIASRVTNGFCTMQKFHFHFERIFVTVPHNYEIPYFNKFCFGLQIAALRHLPATELFFYCVRESSSRHAKTPAIRTHKIIFATSRKDSIPAPGSSHRVVFFPIMRRETFLHARLGVYCFMLAITIDTARKWYYTASRKWYFCAFKLIKRAQLAPASDFPRALHSPRERISPMGISTKRMIYTRPVFARLQNIN